MHWPKNIASYGLSFLDLIYIQSKKRSIKFYDAFVH